VLDFSTSNMSLSTRLKLYLARRREVWLAFKVLYCFSLLPWQLAIEWGNMFSKITKMAVGVGIGLADGISLNYKYGTVELRELFEFSFCSLLIFAY
jgi:hypothetical protein